MQRFAPGVYDPDQDVWELYYLPDDFSQAKNVAAEHPDKVKELVRPVLAGGGAQPRPAVARRLLHLLRDPAAAADHHPLSRSLATCRTCSAAWCRASMGRSYAIEGELQVPDGGAEGVIVANADFIGGFALWVDDKGLLCHTYSFLGVETYKQVSSEPIPRGDVIGQDAVRGGRAQARHAAAWSRCWANDRQIGEGRIEHTVPVAFSSYSGMDIGRDNGLVVDLAYEDKAPYAFTGTVEEGRLRPEAGQAVGPDCPAPGGRRGRRRCRRGRVGRAGEHGKIADREDETKVHEAKIEEFAKNWFRMRNTGGIQAKPGSGTQPP